MRHQKESGTPDQVRGDEEGALTVTLAQTETLVGQMLDGQMADDDIRDLLITLADRGETAAEIAGAARAMRARMIRVSAPTGAIDVCGTGGDGSHSLNVSTAVALVVAACEVPVAKHGNRAASSKAGAADTLEALGLNLGRAAETAEASLADLGICFLFAQKHHPALGPIMPIRRALGRRTIFNLLGPLCNPAGVTRQLVGVADPALIPVYADAIALLGADSAMVVAGDEPLDELSVAGGSSLVRVQTQTPFVSSEVETLSVGARPLGLSTSLEANGFGNVERITPETAGLPRHPPEALRGGDAAYNAAALRRLLLSEVETAQDRAYRDAVLLNAAAGLMVAGHATDWTSGAEEAAEVIDKGLANALLGCWVQF
jgi:anthranilate phosphoribosyltransferase